MELTCIIVDDEPAAVSLLESYVNKTSFLTLKASFNNPVKALDHVKSNPVDLIYLDINMPGLTGLELAQLIPEGTHIVFTTAYSEHAVESYRLSVLDYLLKPISYAQFVDATSKALTTKEESKAGEDHFFIKADYKIQRINHADLMYIENIKDYVRFHLKDGRKLMSLLSLKNLDEQLPNNFMRVHRSYIVNLDEIETIERNRIVINTHFIPVADKYKEEFKRHIDQRMA